MSIPQDQVPKVTSTADGEATQYSYSFYAPDPANVFVSSNGALVTEGWRAVKVSDDEGYIQFDTAPEAGTELTIYRSTPMTQDTEWNDGATFYAETLTSAADKLTMIAQELRGGTVNVPGTVVTAHSATYATSATSAGRATLANSAASATVASGLTDAAKNSLVASASYSGPFAARTTGATTTVAYLRMSAGAVCTNGSSYPVESASVSVPLTGGTVYLVGTSSGTGYTFSYTGTEPTSSAGQFYARIASYEGAGVVKQFQFGDIVDTVQPDDGVSPETVSSALSAGIASGLTEEAMESVASSITFGGYSGPFAAKTTATTDQGDCVVGVSSGCVVVGASRYTVASSGTVFVASGRDLYLVGSSGGGTSSFSYTDTLPASAANQFVTKIAHNAGGTMTQFQYGEITTVPWGLTSSGGGGTMLFPDYAALTENATVNIHSGGDTYTSTNLDVDELFYATEDGYLRVSIHNVTADGCMRAVIDGEELPLLDVRSGGPGTTTLLPVSRGASFKVILVDATGTTMVKFDHDVSKDALTE